MSPSRTHCGHSMIATFIDHKLIVCHLEEIPEARSRSPFFFLSYSDKKRMAIGFVLNQSQDATMSMMSELCGTTSTWNG